MLNGKKWIFFDIGSTLVDESDAYKQRVLETISGTSISYSEFIDTMLIYYRQNGKGDKLAAAHYGLTLMEWKSEYEKLYPQAVNCLHLLVNEYKLGIIANQQPGTLSRLKKFGISEYFSLVVASAEEGVAKPDERIFELAMERADCFPEEAVMIGDRLDNDIAPAKRLGITTIRVLQGYGKYSSPLSDYEIPDFTVSCLDEICGILL